MRTEAGGELFAVLAALRPGRVVAGDRGERRVLGVVLTERPEPDGCAPGALDELLLAGLRERVDVALRGPRTAFCLRFERS